MLLNLILVLRCWRYLVLLHLKGRNGNVVHIGGYSQILGISDVNNQSDTNASSPLFGKINQYGDTKSFNYKANEDGIIMGIYSTSMENDYSSLRVKSS